MIDIRTSLPAFINISSGGIHEINSLDLIDIEPLVVYTMDKGFMGFKRFNRLKLLYAYFIIHAKKSHAYIRIYFLPVSELQNVMSDKIIRMTGPKTSVYYPDKLRRIRYYDELNDRYLVFITNNFNLSSKTIADFYKQRWKIELFFKCIKQHLRIKAFFDRSLNAIKSQIWIAISVYILVIIIKKELNLQEYLYTVLQVLSVNIFSKQLLNELFKNSINKNTIDDYSNQLSFSNF